MRWLDRTKLAKAAIASEGAMLFAQEPAEYAVPLSAPEVAAMQALSLKSFAKAGLAKNDRVLFAVAQPGSPAVELMAQAIAPAASGVAVTGPKGRLRLLASIRALKPTMLVTTPCGAADFLARLYMEFNVDPVELDLRKIVLVGEIASPGVAKRIGKEFEADLAEIYCDPVFGAALACRRGGAWEVAEPGVLAFADPAKDEIRAESATGDGSGAPAELVLRPAWSAQLADAAIRTGEIVAGDPGDCGLFNHTAGEHALVRGRWVSLPLLRRQLALIDGIASWELAIDRGDRSLDSAVLKVVFDRETLVSNPMWKGRIQQAIGAATPVHIDVTTELVDADRPKPKEAVADLRGHHLGVDRARLAAP
jgi:phenylacetate-CoA ligase